MALAQELDNRETLTLSPLWQNHILMAVKRVVDVSVSGFLLIALSPLFAVLALLVKFTSRGPLFYRWLVAGKDGRPFVGYKFRSMVPDADRLKTSLLSKNEMVGPVFKLTRDPRVTPVGAWMRRYSLDELPQLFSVLKGDMSLVGPRPPLVTEYEQFTPFQKQKLAVKPGITCLWQVNGRNEVRDFDEWVRMDLEYIRDWSPGLDFRILFKTLDEIVKGSGK